MSAKEKYNTIFREMFSLQEEFDTSILRLNYTKDWDSVGHITLMTAIEDSFDIMLETDDILSFSTYMKGIEILKKYGIEI